LASPRFAALRRARNAVKRRPKWLPQGVVYSASDEAGFVHGTVVDVDGGRVAVAS